MKKTSRERLDCIGGLEDITPQEVVRAAMKIASKDVRLPKCVRDGVVKLKDSKEK